MIRRIAQAVSLLLHPLFLFLYVLWFSYIIDPYAFKINDDHQLGVMIIMTVMLLLVIPLITTVMMKGLGFIQSLSMNDPKERIGPLIACMICYIWHYVNVNNNPDIPASYQVISLGGCISVALVFFINNFSKISMHTVGAGAFVGGTISILFIHIGAPIELIFGESKCYVHPVVILMICITLAGLIGTSRMILNAHRPIDIYGGYLVGLISIIVASRIVI